MYSWASKVSEKYVCSHCGEAVEFGTVRVCLENTQISKIHTNIHNIYCKWHSSEEDKVSAGVSDERRADVIVSENRNSLPHSRKKQLAIHVTRLYSLIRCKSNDCKLFLSLSTAIISCLNIDLTWKTDVLLLSSSWSSCFSYFLTIHILNTWELISRCIDSEPG